ncbi:hypothetical protein LX36DRAFT_298582 [Colletotrichum falcatum]|nr:hypothetical protein LX36DRAFT_298582 [Colletotrichum falcatum]
MHACTRNFEKETCWLRPSMTPSATKVEDMPLRAWRSRSMQPASTKTDIGSSSQGASQPSGLLASIIRLPVCPSTLCCQLHQLCAALIDHLTDGTNTFSPTELRIELAWHGLATEHAAKDTNNFRADEGK